MRILLLYIVLLLSPISKINAQWMQQYSTTNNDLYGVSFADSLNGWTVGSNGIILHTSDGGNTWITQESGVTSRLNSVSFCDKTNGWAIGYEGIKIKTTDGGQTWNLISHDNSSNTRNLKVQSISPETVIVLRDTFQFDIYTDERIWKSSDGGTTWNQLVPVNNQLIGWWTDFHFTSEAYGWIVGIAKYQMDKLQVIRTIDGGLTFDTTNINWRITGGVRKIYFENESEGWVVGSDSIYHSTDSGVHWAGVRGYPPFGTPNGFIMFGNIGYILQHLGPIAFTTDKGLTWLEQSTSPTDWLKCISFVSPTKGWIVGAYGQIFHTNNGGISTDINETENVIKDFSVYQNYPNPFNPNTKIKWQSPVSGYQSLKVYDVLGNLVSKLVDEFKPAGSYEVNFDASSLSSGVYFYQLRVGDPSSSSPQGQAGQGYVETKSMVLLK